MIYTCDKCHFTFERVGTVDACPDCGKPTVREANEVERNEFQKNLRDKGELMGVMPAGIKITGAKTRWGSCSGKNSTNFSWRLVMAGEEIIDYVIVHELAHIREHNHSPRFWAVVESVMPDYKDRRRKLKLLQKKLAAEDWDE